VWGAGIEEVGEGGMQGGEGRGWGGGVEGGVNEERLQGKIGEGRVGAQVLLLRLENSGLFS